MSNQSSRGAKWEALRKRVLDRDGHVCQYCGDSANEADHRIPKSKGGEDTLDNLVAACKICNGQKRDLLDARVNWYNKRYLTRL